MTNATRPTTILMADDDPSHLVLAEAALAGAGFMVHTVGDGADAVEQFEQVNPDFVILDVNMPKMSGHGRLPRTAQDDREPHPADPDAHRPQRPAGDRRCLRGGRQRLRAEGTQPPPARRTREVPASRPGPAAGTPLEPLEAAARATHRPRRSLGAQCRGPDDPRIADGRRDPGRQRRRAWPVRGLRTPARSRRAGHGATGLHRLRHGRRPVQSRSHPQGRRAAPRSACMRRPNWSARAAPRRAGR